MASAAGPKALLDVASAVGGSRADVAVTSAVAALKAGVAPLDVLRAAVRAYALHYDVTDPAPPHGLVVGAAVANLLDALPAPTRRIAALRAVALLAGDKKSLAPVRAPLALSGEVSHLGRSFLFAARDGDLPQAESVLLGIVDERRERRMAGDILFRAAVEDMADGGHKLLVAVKSWQLARALGFRDARVLLRPAVQYLVAGPRDSSAYKAILAVLGRERVDLEALATGGRALDDAGRARLSAALANQEADARVLGILDALRDGFAPTAVADALSTEAAGRLVRAKPDDRDPVLALAFVHAARFVLTFSRTPDRLYVLFQAGLRVHAPSPPPPLPPTRDEDAEAEALRSILSDVDGSRPDDAASRTGAYQRRGFSAAKLRESLLTRAVEQPAGPAARRALVLADITTSEATTGAHEPLMSLARVLAASPKDSSLARGWARALDA